MISRAGRRPALACVLFTIGIMGCGAEEGFDLEDDPERDTASLKCSDGSIVDLLVKSSNCGPNGSRHAKCYSHACNQDGFGSMAPPAAHYAMCCSDLNDECLSDITNCPDYFKKLSQRLKELQAKAEAWAKQAEDCLKDLVGCFNLPTTWYPKPTATSNSTLCTTEQRAVICGAMGETYSWRSCDESSRGGPLCEYRQLYTPVCESYRSWFTTKWRCNSTPGATGLNHYEVRWPTQLQEEKVISLGLVDKNQICQRLCPELPFR